MKIFNFCIDEFDSTAFGEKVAHLYFPKGSLQDQLRNFNGYLEQNQIKFVIGTSDFAQENIAFLEKERFQFISTKVLYEFKEVPAKEYTSSYIIKDSDFAFDRNAFKELIRQLGESSHYYKNLLLQSLKIHEKIYDQWFFNTFHGRAEKIFVAYHQNQPIGILSLIRKNENLYIDLLGVAGHFQGKGIAQVLIKKALDYAKSMDDNLFVYTQGENIAANRCYQKAGFILRDFELIYHKKL